MGTDGAYIDKIINGLITGRKFVKVPLKERVSHNPRTMSRNRNRWRSSCQLIVMVQIPTHANDKEENGQWHQVYGWRWQALIY